MKVAWSQTFVPAEVSVRPLSGVFPNELAGAGFAPLRYVLTLNMIDVDIQGVTDPAVTAAIRRTVRHTLGHLAGAWHVRVSAADGRGHWDLRVRGAFGHHLSCFWASSAGLADVVDRRLLAFLRSVVTPVAVRPRRPTLVSRGVDTERSTRRFELETRLWEDPQEKAS